MKKEITKDSLLGKIKASHEMTSPRVKVGKESFENPVLSKFESVLEILDRAASKGKCEVTTSTSCFQVAFKVVRMLVEFGLFAEMTELDDKRYGIKVILFESDEMEQRYKSFKE